MKMVRSLPALLVLSLLYVSCMGQNDTIPLPQKRSADKNLYKVDSATRKTHDPRKATLYSAIVPGLGQIYNGEIGKGILFMVLYLVSAFLMMAVIGLITTPILWIFGMVDAYKTAEKINAAQGNFR